MNTATQNPVNPKASVFPTMYKDEQL